VYHKDQLEILYYFYVNVYFGENKNKGCVHFLNIKQNKKCKFNNAIGSSEGIFVYGKKMTLEMNTFRCRNVDPFAQEWREIV
jgi:hypothetical protein